MKKVLRHGFRRAAAIAFAALLGCGGERRQDPFAPPSGLVGNIGSSD